ncbi:hypothetical protein yrohd0001_36770 [Yersinia rohdei ATCC 43380]|nr:hypothetical protein yrohd0001_36770 [Yersinia rohdei ATCC 43380]
MSHLLIESICIIICWLLFRYSINIEINYIISCCYIEFSQGDYWD